MMNNCTTAQDFRSVVNQPAAKAFAGRLQRAWKKGEVKIVDRGSEVVFTSHDDDLAWASCRQFMRKHKIANDKMGRIDGGWKVVTTLNVGAN